MWSIQAGSSTRENTMQRALVHVVSPVTLGAFIYLTWRTPSLRVFRWVEAVGLAGALADLRVLVSSAGIVLPRIVLFSLPDGLWVYALTAAMMLLWRREPASLAKYSWGASALVLSVGAELGQALHIVRGSFDVADLACYAVAATAACVASRRFVPVSSL